MFRLYKISMENQNKIKILVIVGPTARGKSALAWELAQKYSGELISADSRQVYRGLDIGTGKEKFPQHLIDVADPDQDYNVSSFVDDAKKAIEDISARGKLPIIVGGSGFWVDSLVFGHELPEVTPDKELRRDLEQHSAAELHAKLMELDPHRGKHIDKHNKRRLIRAIELVTTTGEPTPLLKSESAYDALWIGIKVDKEELDARIEKRLNHWFDAGLIEETKKLTNPERFGLAYTAIGKYLKGEIDEQEMHRQALSSIKQYAKRQMTWFKRNKAIRWIALGAKVDELLFDFLQR